MSNIGDYHDPDIAEWDNLLSHDKVEVRRE
jgi:hypothetical protein